MTQVNAVPGGRIVADEFHVLGLHSFEAGIVRGVDSPVYLSRRFAFSVEELIETALTTVWDSLKTKTVKQKNEWVLRTTIHRSLFTNN